MPPLLARVKPEKDHSHKYLNNNAIATVKRHEYVIKKGYSIGGDAPKELIGLYEYGEALKSARSKWPLYIAKTARKWYPTESITEYLLYRLGCCLGMRMAPSKLVRINGQVRFLSKYFLSKGQQLLHGADIFANLLNKEFVDVIENEKLERHFITVQSAREALAATFDKQLADELFLELCKLLAFDAFVGNNDRHFYNWGVIAQISGDVRPYFSPIYDTARGLFWNTEESKIVQVYHSATQQRDTFLSKYALNKSRPKVAWEDEPDIDHYELLKRIQEAGFLSESYLEQFFHQRNFEACQRVVKSEFERLLGKERLFMIEKCLEMRLVKIKQTLSLR